MSGTVKTIDHADYQAKVETLTNADLAYTVKDAGEAVAANPNGPNAGYYLDEIHYATMELRRRGVV